MIFSSRQGVRNDDTFECSEDGTNEIRQRGLEDDGETKAVQRVKCGRVSESSLETGGRAAELFEAAHISLPRELVEFELSNNDDRDWPRRIVAE